MFVFLDSCKQDSDIKGMNLHQQVTLCMIQLNLALQLHLEQTPKICISVFTHLLYDKVFQKKWTLNTKQSSCSRGPSDQWLVLQLDMKMLNPSKPSALCVTVSKSYYVHPFSMQEDNSTSLKDSQHSKGVKLKTRKNMTFNQEWFIQCMLFCEPSLPSSFPFCQHLSYKWKHWVK